MQTQIETNPAQSDERQRILEALSRWIKQRPGVDPRNYISSWNDREGRSAYRQEVRSITRDLHQARQLLAAVSWRTSIGAAELKEAFRAYSGRLTWNGQELEYCTGQYWPTEYRRAVCAVLASALWAYFRANMPEPDYNPKQHEKGAGYVPDTYKGLSAGDYLRRTAKRELGATIAKRWFN